LTVDQSEFQTPEVTTGPLPASTKTYTNPKADPSLRVPHRSIALHPTANEPPVPVYDTSGPYSDPSVTIDVEKGLERHRTSWVLERGGVETYKGRDVKPEDNGGATGRFLKMRRSGVSTARWSRNMNSPKQASSPKK